MHMSNSFQGRSQATPAWSTPLLKPNYVARPTTKPCHRHTICGDWELLYLKHGWPGHQTPYGNWMPTKNSTPLAATGNSKPRGRTMINMDGHNTIRLLMSTFWKSHGASGAFTLRRRIGVLKWCLWAPTLRPCWSGKRLRLPRHYCMVRGASLNGQQQMQMHRKGG